MPNINSLTYNGTKSTDLGVYVTGSGSFDAAEFDVDKYEIPGRNGDLILSNNRYKNIEITYPAFIPKAFMDKVQNVRNWLRSSKVYARLEDTYDTDHYRLGIPTGVQSFSPENRNDGANFEITFDCKPQRFLKVGETPETVEADVQTESGEIVTFETVAESPITSASVSLSPIQSLNGYDSPWPGGGGVNKLPPGEAGTKTNSGITIVSDGNGKYSISGTSTAKLSIRFNFSASTSMPPAAVVHLRNNVRIPSAVFVFGSGSSQLGNVAYSTQNRVYDASDWLGNATIGWVQFYFNSGVTVNATVEPMVCTDSTVRPFSPYSNICPISGHTGAELNIAEEYESEDATTYSVTFTDQGTVYGGTYDFVSGKLTVTWIKHTMTGNEGSAQQTGRVGVKACEGAPAKIGALVYCSAFNAVASGDWAYITTSMTAADLMQYLRDNPTDICYELATPLEYTLSPQQLTTLQGQNVVWGAGPITLTYAEPYNVENPTLFDARPLFTVTNPAEDDVIMVNGQAITFVDGYTGTVFIDCETMNAYSGAANLNSIIQATDFPVLVPGTNIVTWTGAGECTMTPRWWEL